MGRAEPDLAGDELTLLTQFLDYYRATILTKVAGLDRAEMATTLPPSDLTLAGVVKHLALVEYSWFQEDLLGRGIPEPFAGAPWDDDRDWEWHTAVEDDPAWLVALYEDACARSRAAVAEVGDLDALSARTSREPPGQHFSLRWILLHMIEETARHAGHADLLRQAVDGTVGD